MRALTIFPWWAWAIAEGHKRQEFRSWRPNCQPGERIAIHASAKTWFSDSLDDVEEAYGVRPPDTLTIAAIMCIITVESVTPDEDGGWAINIRSVEKVTPVDCKGQVRFWTVPPAIESQLQRVDAAPGRKAHR